MRSFYAIMKDNNKGIARRKTNAGHKPIAIYFQDNEIIKIDYYRSLCQLGDSYPITGFELVEYMLFEDWIMCDRLGRNIE